jgi:hypothetical protein
LEYLYLFLQKILNNILGHVWVLFDEGKQEQCIFSL